MNNARWFIFLYMSNIQRTISNGQSFTLDVRIMADVFILTNGKSTALQMAIFKDLDMHLLQSSRSQLKSWRTSSPR